MAAKKNMRIGKHHLWPALTKHQQREYKLLQLRQYWTGDALKAIEGLGHSAAAYEIAKERLDRKFAEKRRQLAIHLEEMENIKPIRNGNAKDLELC